MDTVPFNNPSSYVFVRFNMEKEEKSPKEKHSTGRKGQAVVFSTSRVFLFLELFLTFLNSTTI